MGVVAADGGDGVSVGSSLASRESRVLGEAESVVDDGVAPAPFPHQVGGHGAVATHGAGLVKKPFVERELAFYEYTWGELVDRAEAPWTDLYSVADDGSTAPATSTAPNAWLSKRTRARVLTSLRDKLRYREHVRWSECSAGRTRSEVDVEGHRAARCTAISDSIPWLREFTARYYGMVAVMRTCEEWRIPDAAREAPRNDAAPRATPSPARPVQTDGRAPASRLPPKPQLWYAENGSLVSVNPWARVCYERSFHSGKCAAAGSTGTPPDDGRGEANLPAGGGGGGSGIPATPVMHEFLVLEDLTGPFRYPSVLDVKIGVRDYDDDATEEKKQRHIEKCRMTTSAAYGVRLTGMQVFQPRRRTYLCHDKYHGRRLRNARELIDELCVYVDDGERTAASAARSRAIAQAFIQRLQRLLQYVERQREWKFYSSSLLFIYEGAAHAGAKTPPDPPVRVRLRMIDFAHTQRNADGDTSSDEGYTLGIRTMTRLFTAVAERLSQRLERGEAVDEAATA